MSFEDLDDTTEEHERRIMRCKACNAMIIFLQSPNTPNKVPTDADTVEPHDEIFEHGRHVNHFTTCSDPNRFSKGRK